MNYNHKQSLKYFLITKIQKNTQGACSLQEAVCFFSLSLIAPKKEHQEIIYERYKHDIQAMINIDEVYFKNFLNKSIKTLKTELDFKIACLRYAVSEILSELNYELTN